MAKRDQGEVSHPKTKGQGGGVYSTLKKGKNPGYDQSGLSGKAYLDAKGKAGKSKGY